MSRMIPRPEARTARHLALAVIVLALAAAVAPARAQGPESLDRFPKATLEIKSGDATHHFKIWIADTGARSEQGLMFVHSLPADQGMLFPVVPPRVMSMWMKNTLIPLDMLFIDSDGRIVYIKRNATPQSLDIITTPTPAAFSSARPIPVKGVLELAGGECDRLHIVEGDRVQYALFGGAS